MQNVIQTFIAACLFNSYQVVRLLDNAEQGMIARRQRAKAAGIDIGEVVTNRALSDALLYLT